MASSLTSDDLWRGHKAYVENEGRDPMYRVATFLLKGWWDESAAHITDALTVLLSTWNAAFYRFGMFDHRELEACLQRNWRAIEGFRARSIDTLATEDDEPIRKLFSDFLEALMIESGTCEGRKSPVAVAKALHLLAPAFFPIWDQKIAQHYVGSYAKDPPRTYLRFCYEMQRLVSSLSPLPLSPQTSLLKQIDEFNYVRYTKGWIADESPGRT